MYRRSGIFTIIFFILLFTIVIDIIRLFFGLLFNLSGILLPLIAVSGICFLIYKLVNDKEIINKFSANVHEKKNETKDEIATLFASKNDVCISENITVSKEGFYKGFSDLILRYNNESISTVGDLSNLYPATYTKLKESFIAISKQKARKNNDLKYTSVDPHDLEVAINDIDFNKVAEVAKPQISDYVIVKDSRIETFAKLLENTNYGSNNSEYVSGHKQALINQYQKAYDLKNLNLYENQLNEEISKYSSQTLKDKGYYDGLIYSLKALKKSKELFLEKVNRELEKEL